MIEELKKRLDTPSSRGLADAVSSAIRDGVLAEGDRLPPIRSLASGLLLSPTTVSAAWALLLRAGTIQTDGRRGTIVAGRRAIGPARYRRAVDRGMSFELDLSSGVADPRLLPDLGPAIRSYSAPATSNQYVDDPVLPELGERLRSDWPYAAERFAVVDGAMDAQDLVASNRLRFGDRVVVEDPCFPPLLDLLDAIGVTFIGVALDGEGLADEGLAAGLAAGARAVFLQPRAHNPTGISYTHARLSALARTLLRYPDVLVVEEDSTGAISVNPATSIGSHLPERTIHIRSYSKSHGPDLRLAAVSGPARLLDPIVERRTLGQGWTSRLLQSVLLDLLTRKASVAQVERARVTYGRRRAALMTALAALGVEIAGTDGINVWLPVQDEAAALIRLASRGIGAAAGGPFSPRADAPPHLRVTAGLITTDHKRIAGELADAAGVGPWRSAR